MRRLAVLLTLMLVPVPLWTAPALAKGPLRVVVTGPGLPAPVEVSRADEHRSAFLDLLQEGSGVNTALYREFPGDFTEERPPGELGPAYRLTWYIPDAGGERATIVQDVHPHATPRPVVHTAAQKHVRRAGWYESQPYLRDTLLVLGIPDERAVAAPAVARAEPPAAPGLPAYAALGMALPVAALLVVVLVQRRRITALRSALAR